MAKPAHGWQSELDPPTRDPGGVSGHRQLMRALLPTNSSTGVAVAAATGLRTVSNLPLLQSVGRHCHPWDTSFKNGQRRRTNETVPGRSTEEKEPKSTTTWS